MQNEQDSNVWLGVAAVIRLRAYRYLDQGSVVQSLICGCMSTSNCIESQLFFAFSVDVRFSLSQKKKTDLEEQMQLLILGSVATVKH